MDASATTGTYQRDRAGDERITVENMASLCTKSVRLNITPIEIPDITFAQPNVDDAASTEDVVATEPIPAENEQQPEAPPPPIMTEQPCDKQDYLSMVGGPALTDAERAWLARYNCLDRLQLAELREAFLLFAVNAPEMTPRSAAVTADEARLDGTEVERCLRAIGQNPTQVDIARITSYIEYHHQQQQQQQMSADDDGGGAELTAGEDSNRQLASQNRPSVISSSNRALLPGTAPTGQQSMKQPPAGARTLGVATDVAANTSRSQLSASRFSVDDTDPSRGLQITMDEYLSAANAYGKMPTEEAQVDDLEQAFAVFDEMQTGKASAQRLRSALTTLGDRLAEDDVDAMMELMADELADSDTFDYRRLVDKLASV